MRKWLYALALLVSLQTAATAAEDPVFYDYQALISTPLNPRVLKTTEKDGIVTEEVMFHSENDGDKSVDIFAYFCYPRGGSKLPAFIWNQGGLYQATTYFPELGAKRGYAAMCIDFPIPGYRSTGGYPINSGLELGDDPRKAPIFHGAVALLKAVSYLQSRPEVDPNRVGMCGSSWGGFFTTLMIGVDPRLKAGSAMFGTGNLQLGNNWWTRGKPNPQTSSEAFREHWRTTLDPAWRLANMKTPIAWFTGTNDVFYWMPSLMRTYETAAGPKHLTLLPNYNHGLTPILDDQVFAWLDTHLKGETAFEQVTPLQLQKTRRGVAATWTFSGPRQVTQANLILSYGDDGNWFSRYWKVLPARIKDKTCTVNLPKSAVPFYIGGSVTEKNGYLYSTPLLRIDPAEQGLQDAKARVWEDGADTWGSFEEAEVIYCQRHGYPLPALSAQAHDGKQSGELKTGTYTSPPLLFTTGVPHRFSCYLKAAKPAKVTVKLHGNFDAETAGASKDFEVGTEWRRYELDFTPPIARAADLRASFVVPADNSVLLDTVRFEAVSK